VSEANGYLMNLHDSPTHHLDLDAAREVFEGSTDMTVGLEEEFALLDPATLDLVPRYEELYARGAYAPKAERERLSRLVSEGRRVTRLDRDPAADGPNAESLTADPEDAEPEMAAPPAEQPSLF
jgi:hypothetical protein